MLHKLKFLAVAGLAIGAVLILSGCGNQPAHPNQINSFDGASYDSLTLAHGALTALRGQVSIEYPQYITVFNDAAAAYSTTFNAYTLFRAEPSSQAEVSMAMKNLTLSVIALESAFESGMEAKPEEMLGLRKKAARAWAAAGVKTSVADVLTELEIAAAVAQAVDPSEPYAVLASLVIEATHQAVAAESAAAGRPIDLSTIQPVAPIQ